MMRDLRISGAGFVWHRHVQAASACFAQAGGGPKKRAPPARGAALRTATLVGPCASAVRQWRLTSSLAGDLARSHGSPGDAVLGAKCS